MEYCDDCMSYPDADYDYFLAGTSPYTRLPRIELSPDITVVEDIGATLNAAEHGVGHSPLGRALRGGHVVTEVIANTTALIHLAQHPSGESAAHVAETAANTSWMTYAPQGWAAWKIHKLVNPAAETANQLHKMINGEEKWTPELYEIYNRYILQ
jgi:hypothetical protein